MNDKPSPYDNGRDGHRAGAASNPADGRSDHMTADPGPAADALDDRLLALALGLDEDPVLRAQLAESAELRARFERLQDDLAAVEDGVLRAVPPEPADWADLSAERWAALRPFVSIELAPASRQGQRREQSTWWRRWQALAPAAAAVVIGVAVLGVVMSRDGLQPLGDMAGGGSDKAAESSDDLGAAAPPSAAARSLAIEGAADYGTVVVARAGAVDGSNQVFTVERTLKGSAPPTLRLETEVDGQVQRGSLAVLFLDPRDNATPCPTPQVLDDNGTTASPSPASEQASPTGTATDGGEPESGILYLYNGRCAAVLTLPEDMKAADVQIE